MPVQNENKTVTIYDIAREAGVSAATVSRVLSGSVKVSQEKQEKVMELVERYNFKPNALAKGLSNARSRIIGILNADVRNPYYAELFVACELAARKTGYTVLLVNTLEAWKAVTDTPYISGQFLWTGIDYLGEAKKWPVHGSGAGLLSLAGFEKTEYYRRQSFWSEKPMIHLATALAEDGAEEEFSPVSECWNYPEGSQVLVKCYTNLSRIAFFLNERQVGIYERNPDRDCIRFILPFEAGVLKACSVSEDATLTDSIYTTGCACQYICSVTKSEELNGRRLSSEGMI